tara:strand:- start:2162 stop:2758 length:597 start_codon:yes stop_codon:yes gene_type:complete
MKKYQERNPNHIYIKSNETAPQCYLNTDDAVAYLTNIKSDGESFINDFSIYQIDPDYRDDLYMNGRPATMEDDFPFMMGCIGRRRDVEEVWKPEYLKSRMKKVVDVKTDEGIRKGMSKLFFDDLFEILNTHTFLDADGEDIYEDVICNYSMIEKIRGEDDEPSITRAFASLSVGDIIVNNHTGKAKVVADFGFEDIQI